MTRRSSFVQTSSFGFGMPWRMQTRGLPRQAHGYNDYSQRLPLQCSAVITTVVYTAIEVFKESCVFVRVLKVKGYDPPRSPPPTRKCGKNNRLFSACIYTFFSWEFPNFQVLCLWLYRRNFNTQMVYWNWARFQIRISLSSFTKVIGEGWTIGITEIWQSSPATFFWVATVCPSIAHFCRRNSRSWNLEERTGDCPPDFFPAWFCFWGVVCFVLNGHFWFFLCPKIKGTILVVAINLIVLRQLPCPCWFWIGIEKIQNKLSFVLWILW